MTNRLLSLSILAATLFLCTGDTLAQVKKPQKTIRRGVIATITGTTAPAPALPADAQRRYDAFIKTWSTIRDGYFDKTFNNLNWNAIRAEYEPRVKAAKTDSELYRILNEMLGRLNRSHLSVIPPEVYRTLNIARKEAKDRERQARQASGIVPAAPDVNDEDDPLASIDDSSPYGIGVELRLLDDRFVISRMDPNSAAEYVGLKPGYIIEKVNGVSLQEMLTRILIYNSAIHSTGVKQFVPAYVVSSMIDGEPDTYVTLDYLDENDQPKQLRIRREPLKEKTITIAPNFPPVNLSFESRSADDANGYIRFNSFAMPVIGRFCQAIGDLRSKNGLIIDLRGNTGGSLAAVPVLAGMLTDSSLDLGTTIFRTNSQTLSAQSKAKNFKGRIVVLVDDRTASAAEMFALSLRENGRALIVGQHTSGEALPSIALKLPTGAMLLYPIANYRSPGGTYIEGNGIEPDRPVIFDRKALLTGRDVQLDMAKSLLADDKAFAALKPKKQELPPSDLSGPVPPPPAVVKKAPEMVATPKLSVPSLKAAATKMPAVQDAESKKYIDGFLRSIGGVSAIRSISSLAIRGRATISAYGTTNPFTLEVYRENEDKFAEILTSDATGEIREVINGKVHFVQTDFNGIQDMSSIPSDVVTSDVFSILTTLVSANELYPALSFRGIFDREGKKSAVIEGRTKNDIEVAMVFDVETGTLVNFTRGLSSISFSDYRKVGELVLPFKISQSDLLNVQLDDIKVNTAIDPSFFTKRVSCFDKVD